METQKLILLLEKLKKAKSSNDEKNWEKLSENVIKGSMNNDISFLEAILFQDLIYPQLKNHYDRYVNLSTNQEMGIKTFDYLFRGEEKNAKFALIYIVNGVYNNSELSLLPYHGIIEKITDQHPEITISLDAKTLGIMMNDQAWHFLKKEKKEKLLSCFKNSRELYSFALKLTRGLEYGQELHWLKKDGEFINCELVIQKWSEFTEKEMAEAKNTIEQITIFSWAHPSYQNNLANLKKICQATSSMEDMAKLYETAKVIFKPDSFFMAMIEENWEKVIEKETDIENSLPFFEKMPTGAKKALAKKYLN